MLISGLFMDEDWSDHARLQRLLRRSNTAGHRDARYWSLREASRKCESLPQAFGREFPKEDDYLQKMAILVMADAPGTGRLCRCGLPAVIKGRPIDSLSCGQRRFCQRCNYGKKKEKIRTYTSAFDRSAAWYGIHISFSNSVDFSSYMGTSLGALWDAARAALHQLFTEGEVEGLFGAEELHVESFWPEIRVLPHIHAFVSASMLHEEDLKALLKARVAASIKRSVPVQRGERHLRAELRPAPSVDVKLITRQKHLLNAVGYCVKTMNIVAPYKQGLEETTPSTRWQLNQNVREFFEGLTVEMDTDTRNGKPMVRRQLFGYGNLKSGRSRGFIGVRPKDRRKENATVYGLMEMINDDDEIDEMWAELRDGQR